MAHATTKAPKPHKSESLGCRCDAGDELVRGTPRPDPPRCAAAVAGYGLAPRRRRCRWTKAKVQRLPFGETCCATTWMSLRTVWRLRDDLWPCGPESREDTTDVELDGDPESCLAEVWRTDCATTLFGWQSGS